MLTIDYMALVLTTSGEADPTAATIAAYASLGLALDPLLVITAAAVVLVWHGIRGTDRGPAGRILLTLVRIVLRQRTRTIRHAERGGQTGYG